MDAKFFTRSTIPKWAARVLAKLLKSEPYATLTMAGSDKGSENDVKLAARRIGVAGAVRFVGFLDAESKLKELSAADIYINTNRTDRCRCQSSKRRRWDCLLSRLTSAACPT